MSQQLGFSFDASRCSGCMACIVACMDQNDLPDDTVSFRHVTKLEKGEYPSAQIYYFSLSCLHCGDAPCLMVCPTGAIHKKEVGGIVTVNRDLCVGCHSCALACPFGAPQFTEDGMMNKCDLCHTRMEHGFEPACVRTCPSKALGLGPMEKLSEEKSEKASIRILESLIATGPGKE